MKLKTLLYEKWLVLSERIKSRLTLADADKRVEELKKQSSNGKRKQAHKENEEWIKKQVENKNEII